MSQNWLDMHKIDDKLRNVTERIHQAATGCGRDPETVQLIAVSKMQPAEAVRAAFSAGQGRFGENYVQEAVEKQAQLTDLPIEWHFIGPIQSNKTRVIAEHFSWVHSVDRLKVAQRLSEQRGADREPLNVCLQVNVDNEPTKSGVSFDELRELADAVRLLPYIRLRGLMAIPEPSDDPAVQARAFRRVAEALTALNNEGFALDTLSMGMSADMTVAITEGATFVRVGTDIFGARH